MIPYASRTGTIRNLDALRAAGWRLVVSATGKLRPEGFRYGLDNGAWTAHQRGESFNAQAFRRAVGEFGAGADWIVLPDIVAGGLRSLELSVTWLEDLATLGRPLLLPVQDGMSVDDVRPHVGPKVGIFVGGSTSWKLNTVMQWGELARSCGAWLHVGRVNSARRIFLCEAAQADSFDGSGPSRFAAVLPRLDAARRQRGLVFAL